MWVRGSLVKFRLPAARAAARLHPTANVQGSSGISPSRLLGVDMRHDNFPGLVRWRSGKHGRTCTRTTGLKRVVTACVLSLAVSAGCATTHTGLGPVSQKADSLEARLSIDDRVIRVTLDDLQRIQDALLQWLDKHSGNPDHDQLRQVTGTETCFITHDGVARIGAWTLKTRSGRPVLERTVARSQGATVVPVATLAEDDGMWEVLGVSTVVLRRR